MKLENSSFTVRGSVEYAVLTSAGIILTLALALSPGMLKVAPFVVMALLIAFIFPTVTVVCAISLTLLLKPGVRIFEISIGGVSVTEVDGLILIGLLACCRIPKKAPPIHQRSKAASWWPLLAWPLWMVVRSLLPRVGDVLFGSPLVDLRILSAFVVLIPLWVVASRRGGEILLGIAAYSAYAACFTAVTAWGFARLGILAPGEYWFVTLSGGAANDVRPGGEILIPILAVLLVFNAGPLLLNSRILSGGLLIGEILVSQTLSILVAVVVGLVLGLILNWRYLPSIKRILICACLTGCAVMALGIQGPSTVSNADATARFNLVARIGQSSAQYRVIEANTLERIYRADPMVAVIGTGPGSSVSFNDTAVHEVKNLTHNLYNNIIFKSGAVGLLAFIGGYFLISIRLLSRPGQLRRSLVASLGALSVVNFTVPFASTVPGLCGLLCLAAMAVWQIVNTADDGDDADISANRLRGVRE